MSKEKKTTMRIRADQWIFLQDIKMTNYCESLEDALDILIKEKRNKPSGKKHSNFSF